MFHGLWGLRAKTYLHLWRMKILLGVNLGQHVDFGTVTQIGQAFEEATMERDDIYTRKYPIYMVFEGDIRWF